jgi:hypothetical protein
VTKTSKVVDVLLLLGGKQHSYAQGHMLCLYYTLCLMQLSVVCNLILMGCSDDIPVSGLFFEASTVGETPTAPKFYIMKEKYL